MTDPDIVVSECCMCVSKRKGRQPVKDTRDLNTWTLAGFIRSVLIKSQFLSVLSGSSHFTSLMRAFKVEYNTARTAYLMFNPDHLTHLTINKRRLSWLILELSILLSLPVAIEKINSSHHAA